VRLFVALPLPEELQDRLAALGEPLPGVRWLPAENLHVTLRFIGKVEGHQAREIDAELARVESPAFPVTVRGIECHGNGGRARMLWAGIEANAALGALHGRIEAALRRAGFPPEGRKFRPHVTVARIKSNPGARLQSFLSRNGLFRGAPFQADHFVLYSSLLTPDGSRYTPEASYPLSRP